MQKTTKLRLSKKNKNIPANFFNETASMEFKAGPALLFQIINTYNNDTCRVTEFLKFYRVSLLFLEFDPFGLQRVNNEVLM